MDFIPHASGSSGNLYELRVHYWAVGGGIERHGRRLLIEAGLPWGHLQTALDYQVANLDGCLITHSHGDHAQSAAKIAARGVDVYASAPTLAAAGLEAHPFAVELEHLRHVDIRGGWRVLPFDVPHDCEGSMGFLVEAPDGDQLLFATDAAYLPVTAAGCTHFAIECSWSQERLDESNAHAAHKARVARAHMSLERLVEMLSANDLEDLREIWLLHVSPAHGDGEEFADRVRAATGKPCKVAPRWGR